MGNIFAAICASPFVFMYAISIIYNASFMLSDEEREKLVVVLLVIFSPLAPLFLINIHSADLELSILGVYSIAIAILTAILKGMRVFPVLFLDRLILSLILAVPSASVFILFFPGLLSFYGIIEY